MRPPDEPPFLERRSYRRRRLGDAARLLPVLGAILFLLPLMWATDARGVARTGLYLFAVWGGLIVLAFGLSRVLGRIARPDDGPGQDAP